MTPTFEFTVERIDAGKRLDVVVASAQKGISRSYAKTLIENQRVSVDGHVITKAGFALAPGQLVHVNVPEPAKLDLTPQDVGLRLLYEDEHLAVLDKPAGLSVHPSATEHGPTVVHGLLKTLSSLSAIGGVERPGIVHRIDKGTSGILVVSKTDEAHAGLSKLFKCHDIDRCYIAIVYGDLKKTQGKPSGRIETFFGRHPVHRKKMTGRLASGRKAITHWKALRAIGPLSEVECRLETGRTHQIRAHLSELGHGIVGDPLYGDHKGRAKGLPQASLREACLKLDHQLLHAFHLGFSHPLTKEKLEFSSSPPRDFLEIVELAASAPEGSATKKERS